MLLQIDPQNLAVSVFGDEHEKNKCVELDTYFRQDFFKQQIYVANAFPPMDFNTSIGTPTLCLIHRFRGTIWGEFSTWIATICA